MDLLKEEYNNLIKHYGTQKYISLGNFLDSYYSARKRNKHLGIFSRKPEFGRMRKKDISYLVSSFIYLLEQDNQKIPKWLLDEKYILKDPYFTDENCSDNMKGYLLANSPMCYRRNNIYTDRKPLRRC